VVNILCDYCHPILTAVRWAKGCEPHLWQIGIILNVACYYSEWFEWIMMEVVSLNNVLALLWWYVLWLGSSCKCEMWPTAWQGTVRRVQGKVQCSAVGSAGCHSYIKKNISHCVLWSSDNNSLVLHDKWVQPTFCITSPYIAKIEDFMDPYLFSHTHTHTFLTECLIMHRDSFTLYLQKHKTYLKEYVSSLVSCHHSDLGLIPD